MFDLRDLFRPATQEEKDRWELRRLRDNEKTMRFVIAGLSVALLIACLTITFLVTH